MKWKRNLSIVLLLITFFVSGNTNAISPDCLPCPPVPTPKFLSLQDAIFLSLRYSPLVRSGDIQRVIDKFNLRLAQYAYEVQYSLTGGLTYTNATAGSVHSESTTYNVAPAINYLSPIGTQITATATNTFNHTISNPTFFNPQLSIVAVQPLLKGYGPIVTLAPLYNAYDTELVTRLTFRNTVITDITTVITQYTAVIQALNTLKALQLALDASLATLKQYRAEIIAGRRAKADVVQFQANVAQQELSIQAQLITILSTKLTLLQTLGLDPTTQFTVPEQVTMNDKCLPDLQQSIQTALRNDINYQTQKLNLRVSQRNLLVARDNQRWTLNATLTQNFGGGSGGGINQGFGSLFNGQNKSTNINVQLTVPIHNITIQSQLVNAKVGVDQAEIALAATRRGVIANATNAYYTLINTKQQIASAQASVDLANETLKNANIRLNYGRSTPFEVATLQNNLTNAQISLINTQISYVNALASYEQVLGITLERWCINLKW